MENEKKLTRALLEQKKQAVFARFPLLFTLLTTFGVVATLYGFERLIDEVPVLQDNPIVLLATGIVTLTFTGTLYKALSK